MPDYEKMYFAMFNAVTDALEALSRQNYGTAAAILKQAQQTGEDSYVEAAEDRTQDSPSEKAYGADAGNL